MVVGKTQATPKWVPLANETKDEKSCGPISGGFILTHTHLFFFWGGVPLTRVNGCIRS